MAQFNSIAVSPSGSTLLSAVSVTTSAGLVLNEIVSIGDPTSGSQVAGVTAGNSLLVGSNDEIGTPVTWTTATALNTTFLFTPTAQGNTITMQITVGNLTGGATTITAGAVTIEGSWDGGTTWQGINENQNLSPNSSAMAGATLVGGPGVPPHGLVGNQGNQYFNHISLMGIQQLRARVSEQFVVSPSGNVAVTIYWTVFNSNVGIQCGFIDVPSITDGNLNKGADAFKLGGNHSPINIYPQVFNGVGWDRMHDAFQTNAANVAGTSASGGGVLAIGGAVPQGTVAAGNPVLSGGQFISGTGTAATLAANAASALQLDNHGLTLVDVASVNNAALSKTNPLFANISDGTNQLTAALSAWGSAPTGTQVQGVNADVFIAGTIAATAAAGVQKVGVTGATGATLDSTTGAATTPTNGLAITSAFVSAAPSLTTGQSVSIQCDSGGNVATRNYRRSSVVYTPSSIVSSTSPVTIMAAGAANIFRDITQLLITVTPAATVSLAFTLTLSDGTQSTVFDMETGALATSPAAVTPINIAFNPPLPAASAATAWTLTCSVSTVTVHILTVAVQSKNF